MRRGFLRDVQAIRGVQEATFLAQFFPRDRSRAEEIRADRLEQSVRIQRDWFADQRFAVENLAGSIRRRTIYRVEIFDRYRSIWNDFMFKKISLPKVFLLSIPT